MDPVSNKAEQRAVQAVIWQMGRDEGFAEGYAAGVRDAGNGALLEEAERLRLENRGLRQQVNEALSALDGARSALGD
jgi:hypothetical protein